jgi:hypothetical protein
MIQNNAIYYIAMLCKQFMTKKESYLNHLQIIEKICPLITNFTHDQIVLPSHLLQILQEEDTLGSLALAYNFAADFKQTDIALSILKIFNKYNEENFDVSEALGIFSFCFEKTCNIITFQNDIKTS